MNARRVVLHAAADYTNPKRKRGNVFRPSLALRVSIGTAPFASSERVTKEVQR
jgi:hypothetical protein